jgi:membrane-bound metal-dependent hydrolase YbcI (DUF457 family)
MATIFGAFLLMLSYLVGWVDYNWVQFIAILCMIGGICGHIYVNYKKPAYDEEGAE